MSGIWGGISHFPTNPLALLPRAEVYFNESIERLGNGTNTLGH